jgi:methionyl-tRNA synthetase
MPWGVAVPGDKDHIMYVWFDALVNYISAIGWPKDMKKFNSWWPAVQVAGKDNLRQQSAMWQAMLMSAGIEPSQQILIHGFVSNEGQKMSKSLGNVVDPIKLAGEYGTDAVRYYLLRYFHPFKDSDFSMDSFKEVYNADLANGLGNLVSRVAQMVEKNFDRGIDIKERDSFRKSDIIKDINKLIESYNFNKALEKIQKMISVADRLIDDKEPWRGRSDAKQVLSQGVGMILAIAESLKPFLPETSEKIIKHFSAKKIKKGEALFPRI